MGVKYKWKILRKPEADNPLREYQDSQQQQQQQQKMGMLP